jgi:hypothetical protein
MTWLGVVGKTQAQDKEEISMQEGHTSLFISHSLSGAFIKKSSIFLSDDSYFPEQKIQCKD